MKTIQLKTVPVLLVELPEGSNRMFVFNDKDRPYLSYFIKGDTGRFYLPDGNWQLAGKLSELDEEWFKSQVEMIIIGLYRNYVNVSQYKELLLDTARESFYSLLKSEGWYTENPCGEKPKICYATLDDAEGYEALEEWQEAQSRTIDVNRTIILTKTTKDEKDNI